MVPDGARSDHVRCRAMKAPARGRMEPTADRRGRTNEAPAETVETATTNA